MSADLVRKILTLAVAPVPVEKQTVEEPPRSALANHQVECTACGASAYLCASQDDSIAGTIPTMP
jgi:hypothetical protein